MTASRTWSCNPKDVQMEKVGTSGCDARKYGMKQCKCCGNEGRWIQDASHVLGWNGRTYRAFQNEIEWAIDQLPGCRGNSRGLLWDRQQAQQPVDVTGSKCGGLASKTVAVVCFLVLACRHGYQHEDDHGVPVRGRGDSSNLVSAQIGKSVHIQSLPER